MPTWTKEQLEAIEKSGKNIIVSAGAGSGKTAVLTSRVINKLKNNIHINELLILTFTKAAANEMKERIRSSIKEHKELKEELDLIDSSYITTFDSFALSIVKKYHYYLNVPKDIKITDNTIILMKQKEIMDNVFDNFYQSNDEKFNKLINDFCVKDDKELKKSIIAISKKIELLLDKDTYLNEYIKNFLEESTIDKFINEYENMILDKKQQICEVLEDLKYYTDNDYYQKVYLSLENLINCNDIDKLLTIEIKLPIVPRNSSVELKHCKDILKHKIDELSKYKYYGTKKEIKNNILLTKDTILIIIDILKEYFRILDNYKKSNYIYDFQDIALLAIKIVKENEEIQKEVKNSFKEIMIDEYQDTNDIQEEFISLISNNNVYMVGDIKQSIYRFRNANPYIFKNKYDEYSKNIGGLKIDLLKNFRSRKEVLNNINLIFRYVMDDEIGKANYKENHQMIYGNNLYDKNNTQQNYDMEFLEYDKHDDFTNEEIEIFTIGKDILDKINNKYQVFDKEKKELHNASYSDFVILVDRSKSFDLYKKIFEYLGIPLTIYKDEKINEGYDISIIKNIIDLIIHIKNNNFDVKFKFDFISIARSYLYNIDDNKTFNYFLNNNYEDSIIYRELKEIADTIDSDSTYHTLCKIIEKTNLYEKLTTIDNIDNSLIRIERLQELAISLEELGYDIYHFNSYLEQLLEENYEINYSVNNMNINSVRIMTIHKSKGLEFNICYYSGLDVSFNLKDIKERFTFSNKYGIIVPLFKEGIRDNILKELLKNEYIKEEISERIRLFYVALTRAKEKMIFVLPKKNSYDLYKNENGVVKNVIRHSYHSFMDIILSIRNIIEKYIKPINIDDLNLTKRYLFTKDVDLLTEKKENLKVTELSILEDNLDVESYSKKLHELISLKKHNNLELGLKVHETLELIDFQNPKLDLIKDEFIKENVNYFLNNPLFQTIQKAKIYKEYEFMYKNENKLEHGIIDLMLEYENYIDIVDYKLNNIEDNNYILQLKGYKEYIEKISNKKINLYLYSIIGKEVKRIS